MRSGFVPDVRPRAAADDGHMTNTVTTKKLRRSSTDKMIAGVAGGWAALLGVDAAVIRIVLVAATLLGFGAPILLYAICWMLMPQE